MAAIDDLTELVERAAAAERLAVSSKWKERDDVVKLVGRVRTSAQGQRDDLGRNVDPMQLSSRWVSLRHDYLRLGPQDSLPGAAEPETDPGDPEGSGRRLSQAGAAQAEHDAVAAVELARIALTDAALAVLQARLARIDAGEDDPDSRP